MEKCGKITPQNIIRAKKIFVLNSQIQYTKNKGQYTKKLSHLQIYVQKLGGSQIAL